MSVLALVLLTIPSSAQTTGAPANGVPALEWRRIGPTNIELGLASPAGGPVERVWFAPDGSKLYAKLPFGKTFVTEDFENWSEAGGVNPPEPESALPARPPEIGSRVVEVPLQRTRMYAAGAYVYRSDDAGASWSNLTAFRSSSILGGRLSDVAVSPSNVDDVAVAGASGVWRSLDGGNSWTGLNDKLPNLPVQRLLPAAEGRGLVRIATGATQEAYWQPGQKTGWVPTPSAVLERDSAFRAELSGVLQARVTAVGRAADTFYAGTADGRISISTNGGGSWRASPPLNVTARIERFALDVAYGAFAIAITSAEQRGRVFRTVNNGLFWDDITANLPAGAAVSGVAVDRLTGAVYVATERGVFMTYTDTVSLGPATPWVLLKEGPAVDVLLDAQGNQLYVAMRGAGIQVTMAPHRVKDPRVVSSADRALRAVAPGALVSVIGAKVGAARAGDRPASVVSSGETESEIQLPYELPGTGVLLSLESSSGRFQVGFPVQDAAPAVFVDRDGVPLVTNAETGLVLDASKPATPGMRLQILATGLGRVAPAWPAGTAAPLDDPPRVVTPIRVYLDREPLEVIRATLASGYVGLYVVEVQLPSILNRGISELYVEMGSAVSNRVSLYVEP